MIRVYVETTGQSPSLAAVEAAGAARALGGSPAPPAYGCEVLDLPDRAAVESIARRLALARRTLVELPGDGPEAAAAAIARGGGTAAVRRLGRPSGGAPDPTLLAVGAAYVAAGGAIDLRAADHRLWIASAPEGSDRLLEEVVVTGRPSALGRRISLLPFQRPVGLDPRLARAAANLAEVRPGDCVLDPFLGTGALLAEAGLLGARVYGIDRDPAMVRGSLQNFGFLGVAAEEVVEGDAGEVEFRDPAVQFDALLTDPPYGRSSGTGGEAAADLTARVLARWSGSVRPEGRIVVVVPGGSDPVPAPWWREVAVPVRVHRSLTREFRVYVR